MAVLLLCALLAGMRQLHGNPFPGMQPTWGIAFYNAAISLAFGQGFQDIQPGTAPEVDAFIAGQRDALTASSLDGAAFVPVNVDEGRHFYLEHFVSLCFRVFGVNRHALYWPVMLLYLLLAALVYTLLRQCGGVWISFGGALLFTMSSGVLEVMPHLRDFSRALFIVTTLIVLARLMRNPARTKTWLVAAVFLGTILGIGFGFREDAAAGLPLAILTLAALAPLEGKAKWLRRAAAVLLLGLAFKVAALPATQYRGGAGHSMMHYVAGGLITPCHEQFGFGRCAYDWITSPDDCYITDSIDRARRRFDIAGTMPCGMHTVDEYTAGKLYIRQLAAWFPADLVARLASAMLGSLQRDTGLLMPVDSLGFPIAAAAFLLALTRRPRQALAAALYCAYFLGLSSIQYNPRHIFYFSLIPLASAVYLASLAARGRHAKRPLRSLTMAPGGKLALAGVAAVLAAACAVYAGARIYQAHSSGTLLENYASASLEPLPVESVEEDGVAHYRFGASLSNHLLDTTSDWDYLAVDLELPGPELFLRVQYSSESLANGLYSHIVRAERGADGAPGVRFFFPIYQHAETNHWIRFEGISIERSAGTALRAAYRVRNKSAFPVLLTFSLPRDPDAARMRKGIAWRTNDALSKAPAALSERYIGWPPGLQPLATIPGVPEDAIPYCQQLLDERPYAYGPRMALGDAYAATGAPEAAREAYTNAAAIAPEFPVPYTRLECLPSAIVPLETWRTLAETHPAALTPRYFHGRKLLASGDAAQAKDVLRGALEAHPYSIAAAEALVTALLASKTPFPEIQSLEDQALDNAIGESISLPEILKKTFAPVYVAEAAKALAAGQWKDADTFATEALRRTPGDPEAQRIQDAAVGRQGGTIAAMRSLRACLSDASSAAPERVEWSNLLCGKGECSQVIVEYIKAIGAWPDNFVSLLTELRALIRARDSASERVLFWRSAAGIAGNDTAVLFQTLERVAETMAVSNPAPVVEDPLSPEKIEETWRSLSLYVPYNTFNGIFAAHPTNTMIVRALIRALSVQNVSLDEVRRIEVEILAAASGTKPESIALIERLFATAYLPFAEMALDAEQWERARALAGEAARRDPENDETARIGDTASARLGDTAAAARMLRRGLAKPCDAASERLEWSAFLCANAACSEALHAYAEVCNTLADAEECRDLELFHLIETHFSGASRAEAYRIAAGNAARACGKFFAGLASTETGDYATAAHGLGDAIASGALKELKNTAAAHYMRACLETGQFAEARAALPKFTEHAGNDAETLGVEIAGWARDFCARGATEACTICWRAALAASPREFSLAQEADAAFQAHLAPEEAIGTWRELTETLSYREHAWFLLGVHLMRLERYEEAGDAFLEALRIAPHSAFARGFLGWTLLRQGDCAAAAPLLERALHDAPDADVFRAPYAETLRCLGRDAEADLQAGLGD